MKYIISNDILETFNKKKCLFLIYLICLIMISFLFKTYLFENDEIISNSIIGIDFYDDSTIILKIFMIFNFLTYIYIAYYIFLKDTQNAYGNIFSRISKIKWLFSKLISIIIITFIIKLISCIIVNFIYNNEIKLSLYVNNFVHIYLCQIIAIIGYMFSTKSKIISLLLIICCLTIIGLLSFNFSIITSNYYNCYILMIILIFCILIYLIVGKKKIGLVLERNG